MYIRQTLFDREQTSGKQKKPLLYFTDPPSFLATFALYEMKKKTFSIDLELPNDIGIGYLANKSSK